MRIRALRNNKGFTLVEVLVTVVMMVTLIGSLMGAFLSIKSVSMMTRRKAQAIQIVRGQLELLKVTDFATIANGTSTESYDAGADGTFGTADDLQGTLTTVVQDLLDMDGDTNTAETAVDVNGNGTNDPTAAKPIRVSFSWTQAVLGRSRTCTVFADTLVST